MITILTALFYFAVLICVLAEVDVISNPERAIRASRNIKEERLGGSLSRLAGYDLSYLVFQSFYGLTVIIGLLSSQWILFCLILLLSFIMTPFKERPSFRRVDSIICIIILLFIALNGTHFHIDIPALIKERI